MNTVCDRYLSEAMGLKPTYLMQDYKTSLDQNGKPMPDFSTWTGFGKLLDFIKLQEWFEEFLNIMDVGEYIPCSDGEFTFDIQGEFINPDILANAVYEFLKGRES